MAPQIPWSEPLETLLLHCVIVKGAHVCGGKKVTQSWNDVNDMFFQQSETAALKEPHYVSGNARKLRDKYKSLLENVQRDIESGNQSGKEGEQSDLYKHTQTIYNDILEKETEKEYGAVLKEKLNEAEKTILSQAGALKKRQLDGTLVDNTRSDREPLPSFDERMYMLATAGRGGTSKAKVYDESELEIRMLRWIEKSEKMLLDVYFYSNIDDKYRPAIEEIGLQTLVSILSRLPR
jgi:hypothetical protein